MKRLTAIISALLVMTALTVYAASGTITTTSPYNIVINAPAAAKVNVPTSGTLATTSNLNSYVPLAGGTMTGPLVLSGNPTISTQAANKAYVDSVATGLKPIGAVAAKTTANLTATYSNGSSGVGATLTNSGTQVAFTTDGYSASVNDLILVNNQTTQANNGIYSVTTAGTGSTNWVLTRWTSYNTPAQIVPGSLVSITNGTVFAGSSFYETAVVNTIGTDPIIFSSFFTPTSFLWVDNDLSDVASVSTARTNLGLGSIATHPTTDFISSVGTVTQNDLPTFPTTAGNTLQDSGIRAVTYGSPTNLFLSAGAASGNPSIGIGARDIGIGASTLIHATSALDDISIGYQSSIAVTSGGGDITIGSVAGASNVGGSFNSMVGFSVWTDALGGDVNTGVGYNVLSSLSLGSYNTAIGPSAGSNYTGSESSNIDIASLGTLGESHTLHVGDTGTGNGQISTAYWGNVNIPLSTSINTILYNSAANQVAQITPVNNAVVITGSSGIPSESATLPVGLTIPGYLPLAGGTMTGNIVFNGSSPIGLNFTGTNNNNRIVVPTSEAGALVVTDGTNTYTNYNSTPGRPRVSTDVETVADGPITIPNGDPVNIDSPVYNTAGTLNASQSGTTVTGISTSFTSSMVGGNIYWPSTGNIAVIQSVNSSTSLTVDQSQTQTSAAFQIFYEGTIIDYSGVRQTSNLTNWLASIDTPPAVFGNTLLALGANNATGVSIKPATTHGVLIGEGASAINSPILTNGQLLVGSTSADPVAATIGASNGLVWTAGAGSLSIGITAGGIANSSLANSGVTLSSGTNISITGGSLSLGGTATINVAAPFAATSLTSHGILVGENTSNISALSACSNGQVPVGSTSADPVCATVGGTQGVTWTTGAGTLSAGLSAVPNSALANSNITVTAGTGVSVTGSPVSLGGTITVNAVGGGLTWTDITGSSQVMALDNGYTANKTTLVTFTLPATCTYGHVMAVYGVGAGGWQINENSGQSIVLGNQTTTTTTGSLSSSLKSDAVELFCESNTQILAYALSGTPTVN